MLSISSLPPLSTSHRHPPPFPHIIIKYPHSPFPLSQEQQSSTIPSPLSTKPRQPPLLSAKPHNRALGEEKRIPLLRLHLLLDNIIAIAVFELRNLHVAFEEDLHFVVGVGVDEFGARFEAVETGGDGGGGAVAVGWRLAGCMGWRGGEGE